MGLSIRSGYIVACFALASLIQGCENQPYVYDDMSDAPASDPDFDSPSAQVYGEQPQIAPQPAPAEAPRAIPRTVEMPVNTYTIKRGDTLWSIAKQTYGNGQRWREIVNANPGLNPAKLSVGQKIAIP